MSANHPPTSPLTPPPETRRPADKLRLADLRGSLTAAGSLGVTLVACTFLGLWAGYRLDERFSTHPWLTVLLLLAGISAGFLNIFAAVRRLRPASSSKEKDRTG